MKTVVIITAVCLGAAIVLGAVLAVEAWLARGREYLPREAKYRVDQTFQPSAEAVVAANRGSAAAAPDLLRMVMIGDSTTVSLGADTPEESLPGQLAQKIADRLDRPVHVRGFGLTGADTQTLIDEQIPKLAGIEDIDLVAIEIGSNDVLHLIPPWKMQARTAAMLAQVRKAAPGAVIVLGSAGALDTDNFHQPLRAVIVRYATRIRAAQRRAATAAGSEFVDIALEVDPVFDRTPGATSSDGFHPAPPGYDVWAEPLATKAAAAVQRAERRASRASPAASHSAATKR